MDADDVPPIDLDGPELVYVQVANHITSLIESGKLQTGTRLPPERELAKTFGVAYDTVRRANELLRERGLIVTVHGRGTYVKPNKLSNTVSMLVRWRGHGSV